MYLGIDTSNYTTSAAIFDSSEKSASNFKIPLPVKEGERGLRQSDAVFHHTVNLPKVLSEALDMSREIDAVGVSVRPRDLNDSYMPCFRAGYANAVAVSSALNKPLYTFSHQAGHIAAALYSSDRLDLMQREFIAFHFSGGTTEAVIVRPDDKTVFAVKLLLTSLDLKAGQAVDRCGVMLGMKFPAGAELDKLACKSERSYKIKPTLKDGNPCLSGLENMCRKMIEKGEQPCDVAKYTIDYISAVVSGMTEYLISKYGNIPIVYAGGVMSNSMISKHISEKYGGVFAQPQYSTDNAAGIAVLAAYKNGEL